MSNPATPGYAVAGCGGCLALISLGVTLFGAFHVFIDPRGAISASEAMPAIPSGICCGLTSLVIAGGGVFLAMRAKNAAAAEPPKA
jgi:hypothetical protein